MDITTLRGPLKGLKQTTTDLHGPKPIRRSKRVRRLEEIERRYKLSEVQVLALLEEQEYKCYGCKEPITLWSSIDHDHSCCDRPGSCGSCIRAILCANCNSTLGHAKDSPETLERLARLLRKGR